ncbi:anthranilate synthase component I family protein [Helicobacter muridarum]|uniref:Anthranilate synthase component I n=1 Tax=Helicobacter muridarum TaxID=216 RepID=A0A099U066_9HELI|nr:chorismate-binding protein [Helicobacter muridarum]TLE00939.1 anthranilate synthase component I family protein [Helicobacter muridarum]STQ86720.1 anthranilate synthase component I [Helicobacter muridarum]
MNLSYQKINVNMHTALTIYKGIGAKFLLESATLQNSRGRYSILVRENNFILSKEIYNGKFCYFFKQKSRDLYAKQQADFSLNSHSQNFNHLETNTESKMNAKVLEDSKKQGKESRINYDKFDLLNLESYENLPRILDKLRPNIQSIRDARHQNAQYNIKNDSPKLDFLSLASMLRELYPSLPSELESIPIPLGGLGFLCYEFFSECENVSFNKPSLQEIIENSNTNQLINSNNNEKSYIPECLLVFPQECVIFDHFYDEAYIVVCAPNEKGLDSKSQVESLVAEIQSCTHKQIQKVLPAKAQERNMKDMSIHNINNDEALNSKVIYEDSKEWYQEYVTKITKEIYKGTFLQCVLSRAIVIQSNMNPLYVYESLRRINPSPYMYYLNFDDFCIVGASPELMIKCKHGIQTLKPIAGTRKRGKTLQEDRILEDELLNDSKENAEHLMLIDLARNDIGRNSTIGSVRIQTYKSIEKYSSVMHIVSEINGEIRDDKNQNDCLRACFPAGTVSGAPKIEAIKKLASYETHKRGFYSGAIIYFERNGDIDSAITLRSTLYMNGKYYLQVGAGIVMDSMPEFEYMETSNKIKTIYDIIMQ